MHFERLEVQNFASYYGEHSIDLSCTPDCPAVIILGGTGFGKTTLFDGINWALYGSDYERDLVKRRERQIIDYCKSPDFDIEELKALYKRLRG